MTGDGNGHEIQCQETATRSDLLWPFRHIILITPYQWHRSILCGDNRVVIRPVSRCGALRLILHGNHQKVGIGSPIPGYDISMSLRKHDRHNHSSFCVLSSVRNVSF